MLKKVNNPFVSALKAQMETRFHGVQIEVNPRSAWVKGEVPEQVQKTLKESGFFVCPKGWYFTHDCVKMPNFPQIVKAQPAQKPAQVQKPAEKPVKKEWTELSADVKSKIVKSFLAKYPGCQVEVRGTWVYLIGLVFKTNEEYRNAIKADGFHYGFKTQEWSRALKPEEMTVTERAEAPKAQAVNPVQNVSRTPEQIAEFTELRKIMIQASKGLLTHDEMLSRMKEVCPF